MQVEREKVEELPITAFMDIDPSNTQHVGEAQGGFMQNVCLPFFQTLVSIAFRLTRDCPCLAFSDDFLAGSVSSTVPEYSLSGDFITTIGRVCRAGGGVRATTK